MRSPQYRQWPPRGGVLVLIVGGVVVSAVLFIVPIMFLVVHRDHSLHRLLPTLAQAQDLASVLKSYLVTQLYHGDNESVGGTN